MDLRTADSSSNVSPVLGVCFVSLYQCTVVNLNQGALTLQTITVSCQSSQITSNVVYGVWSAIAHAQDGPVRTPW